MITIRPVRPGDAESWLRLRHAFWPDGSEEEHRREIGAFLAGTAAEPRAVLMAEDEEGRALGVAEISIRPCAEGCRTSGVAYLEGWFVEPRSRGRGVGRALVEAVEGWARAQGCTELASDAVAGNDASAAAHLAVGFDEVGLVRCFRKEL